MLEKIDRVARHVGLAICVAVAVLGSFVIVAIVAIEFGLGGLLGLPAN